MKAQFYRMEWFNWRTLQSFSDLRFLYILKGRNLNVYELRQFSDYCIPV